MERAEFGSMIGRICRFWERRTPLAVVRPGDKESEIDIWYETLKWIPDGHGQRIFERFTKMETRPVNIPLRIQEVYKGLSADAGRPTDFLISMVMRHADQYKISHLEAFYDLRAAIKKHEVYIGPAIRWLRSEGFTVDVKKLDEPSIINFAQLRELLSTPGRAKRMEMKEPVALGGIWEGWKKDVERMREGMREPGDE